MPSDFKKLMAARFLFTLAVQIQAIVLGWRMYILTKDPLFLGLIGLVEAIPALGLALYAGYIVDRSRPMVVFRRSLRSQLAVWIHSSGVAAPSTGVSEQLQIVALFLSSFLTGAVRAFSQPAMFSIVPRIIGRENLSRGSAWMASTHQIGRISGRLRGDSSSAGWACLPRREWFARFCFWRWEPCGGFKLPESPAILRQR